MVKASLSLSGPLLAGPLVVLSGASAAAQGLFLPPEAQPPASTPAAGVHIGDYDLDGIVDFTIGADLYRGDGSGNYTATAIRTPAPVGLGTTGPLAAVDLDLDGDLDFVYADGVWIQNAGVYTDETSTRIGTTLPATARIALVYDADNDGDQDLLAIDIQGTSGSYKMLYLQTALNDGTGNFPTFNTRYLAGGSSVGVHGLVAGDFDGNGTVDLALSGFWSDIGYGGRFGGAYPDSGFTRKVGSAVLAGQQLFAAADLDGDGSDDILATTNFNTVAFLGGVTQVPVSDSTTGAYPADFDGDGAIDCLAASTSVSNQFTLSRNDGTATFTNVNLSIPASVFVYASMAIGDLDRDGDADLVLSDPPRVMRNARQQLSAPAIALRGSTAQLVVDAVDVSGPLVGLAQVALSLLPADRPAGPLGALLIEPAFALPLPTFTFGNGRGTVSVPVPTLPSLSGVAVFAQAVVYDSGPRTHLTNRTKTTIQ
ncbi:MAG: VCBS repeat-containing protein [Planctomycetes bacterium]|nr:VCBS repeat-containing protein [Planctomycetota bacterium]